MKWSEFFTSSIGKKFVMALTGIFLVLFLIVHVGLNACIFATWFDSEDHGAMFNKAAHFMGANWVPRFLEVGLFAGILLHIFQGYAIELKNRSTRSVGYAVKLGNRGSKWYSRSMGLLGTLVLLFLIVHIAQFWVPSRITGLEETFIDGKPYHDLYRRMIEVFQAPWVVALYLVGCASLLFHLLHGFQSSFRTIGVVNKRYMSIIQATGVAFSIIVVLLFALMPISMHLGWVK
ncbi:succinate dehydrogenase cytochrome b subunit [Chitinophagaceae bacterium 26-R-25]|nr:succinate dehydrogenase cytochrome b subunit [Chitinophagaceae bacterium 26-R-25]